ncbi:BTAD domain-containing putative transcriptional regulator [Streptomyces hirsutus]
MKGRSTVIGNLGDSYLQAGRLGKAVEYTRRALALDRVDRTKAVCSCSLG